MPIMDYATRLRDWMSRDDLTYQAAAAKLGCDPSALVRWIQGVRTPTGLYRDKVDRVLKASETNGKGRE